MKNAVYWDVTPCVLLLLVITKVTSSLILITLMMEALRSSETSVLRRATRRIIPEDDIFSRVLVLGDDTIRVQVAVWETVFKNKSFPRAFVLLWRTLCLVDAIAMLCLLHS
jgi:hypothetical protein